MQSKNHLLESVKERVRERNYWTEMWDKGTHLQEKHPAAKKRSCSTEQSRGTTQRDLKKKSSKKTTYKITYMCDALWRKLDTGSIRPYGWGVTLSAKGLKERSQTARGHRVRLGEGVPRCFWGLVMVYFLT